MLGLSTDGIVNQRLVVFRRMEAEFWRRTFTGGVASVLNITGTGTGSFESTLNPVARGFVRWMGWSSVRGRRRQRSQGIWSDHNSHRVWECLRALW